MIIILGPPGAGKGTQAQLIAQEFDMIHLSTGELLRDHIKRQTPLGKLAAQKIDQGNYVDDHIVLDMVEQALEKKLILDGVPRTLSQAKLLEKLLRKYHIDLTHVFYLDVNDNTVTQRILERGKTSGRADDTIEVIKKRLEVYYKLPTHL